MTNPPWLVRTPARRLLAILMAVALIVAGGGAETLAQTKRSAVPAWLSIEIRPSPPRGKPLTLCVGETRDLLARVTLTVLQLFNGGIALTSLEPSVANSRSATATLTKKESRPTNYGVAEPFQGARYDLEGIKPGTGKLTFKATLPAGWGGGNEGRGYGYGPQPALHATTTLDYKVQQCDYEVSAVHRWTIPGTLATATMADVRVTADDQGRLSGSGQIEWVLRHRLPPCSSSDTVEPSGVEISGSIGDDGLATMAFAYQAASGRSSVTCPAPCRGGCTHRSSFSITPTELSFSVPADGGTTVRSHPIPGGFAGTALITVESVERTAVASIRANRARGSRSTARHGLLTVASAQAVTGSPDPAVSPAPEASPDPPGVELTLDLADGPFDLPDPTVGLADLATYTSTLRVTFDGTIGGTPVRAASTATMEVSPRGRALTIERGPDGPTTWRAEVDGAAYAKEGDGPCIAEPVREGGSLAETYEPATQLAPIVGADPVAGADQVVGADEMGDETVDGAATQRYAFDQRGVVLPFITSASGEVSVAPSDGHVVRYSLTVEAGPEHFGTGVAGTRTLDYELSVPSEPHAIRLPDECPPLVDAPPLDDATDVVTRPGLMTFSSALALPKAVRSYTRLLKADRWKADGQPVVTKSTALLAFRKGKAELTVIMRRASGSTTVKVVRTR